MSSTTSFPFEGSREVDRAFAMVTGAAVRADKLLADVRWTAEELPLPIRIQFNNAIEELDLLCFHLHELKLFRVVAKSEGPV
jgi:hypothetical protein